MVMTLLVLGIDISALQEAMRIQESTVRTWLTRSGEQGRKLHDRFFKDLTLGHIQLDELWAKVERAQGGGLGVDSLRGKDEDHSSDPTWRADAGDGILSGA